MACQEDETPTVESLGDEEMDYQSLLAKISESPVPAISPDAEAEFIEPIPEPSSSRHCVCFPFGGMCCPQNTGTVEEQCSCLSLVASAPRR